MPRSTRSTSSSAAPSSASSASPSYFSSLLFSISGRFSVPHSSLTSLIQAAGGSVSATVTSEVNYLITDGEESAKLKQAKSLNIPLVDSEWLFKCQTEGKFIDNKQNHDQTTKSTDNAKSDDKQTSKGKKSRQLSEDSDEENSEKKKKVKSGDENQTKSKSIHRVIVKGRVPVDEACSLASSVHVFEDATGAWDACLNQTNIGNNNNKFYNIQLLESDHNGQYWLWNHWGRNGKVGQNSLFPFNNNLEGAKQAFQGKFMDKTKNLWSQKMNFSPVPGKYTLIERDYSDQTDEKACEQPEQEKLLPPSQLSPSVQELIKLLCDIRMMKKSMMEVGFDADKMPLGKISKEQVKKGYSKLQEIAQAIKDKPNSLMQLSSEFYTLIPHKTEGMRPPPVIRTDIMVKEKIQLLESLDEISFATRMLKAENVDDPRNPIDLHYESLKCNIQPIEQNHKEFELIKKYIKQTHGKTHTTYDLELLEAFHLDRQLESERFTNCSIKENRQLLWHGSRLTNFVGILSQGLRIAPPEAPATGYMFGKGVYFADCVSKSANYTFASSSNNVACMLLCEVALGNMNQLKQAEYRAKEILADNQHSTKGIGRWSPDEKESAILKDGTIVPLGNLRDSQVQDSSLIYNEYIVYNVEQVRIKYLVKLKFNYKR
jgi:poly [ADP-ribose] polymerase